MLTPENVRVQFIKQNMRYHPDLFNQRNPNATDAERLANLRMNQEMNEARDYLIDPKWECLD